MQISRRGEPFSVHLTKGSLSHFRLTGTHKGKYRSNATRSGTVRLQDAVSGRTHLENKKQLLTFTSCQRCVGVAQIRQKRVDFRVLYESEAVHQKSLVPEAMARYSQPRVWWGVSTNGVTLMSGVHSNTLTQGVSASKIPYKYTQKSPGSQMGKGFTNIFHFCCDSTHLVRTGKTAMLYYSENWHYRKSWTQALKLQGFQGLQGMTTTKANSKLIQSVKHRSEIAKWYTNESLKRLVRYSNSDTVMQYNRLVIVR